MKPGVLINVNGLRVTVEAIDGGNVKIIWF